MRVLTHNFFLNTFSLSIPILIPKILVHKIPLLFLMRVIVRLIIPHLIQIDRFRFLLKIFILPIINNLDFFITPPWFLRISTINQSRTIRRYIYTWHIVYLKQRCLFWLFSRWTFTAFTSGFVRMTREWMHFLGCVDCIVFVYGILLNWKLVMI